jgi:hypothetical protein
METIETTPSLLTNENFKTLLDSRLQTALEVRIASLEQKLTTDINTTLENLKYEYYDTLKKCKKYYFYILSNKLLNISSPFLYFSFILYSS